MGLRDPRARRFPCTSVGICPVDEIPGFKYILRDWLHAGGCTIWPTDAPDGYDRMSVSLYALHCPLPRDRTSFICEGSGGR